jgi:hypothetical protein
MCKGCQRIPRADIGVAQRYVVSLLLSYRVVEPLDWYQGGFNQGPDCGKPDIGPFGVMGCMNVVGMSYPIFGITIFSLGVRKRMVPPKSVDLPTA